MKHIKDIIRYLLSVFLLGLMWLGNKYALYLLVTLSIIGAEIAALVMNKLIEKDNS